MRDMNNIDLFDQYVTEALSKEEMASFDARLKSDAEFAADFKAYLLTVSGICKEAEQDNLDFGVAMKNLTKEQLQSIIGKPEHVKAPKLLHFRPWIWQAASIAAVVVVAFTFVFNFQRSAQYEVDNAIVLCQNDANVVWRGGSEQPVDINTLTEDELKAELPKLKELYARSTDNQEIADNGYTLALAYIKLHQRKEAKQLLNELINKFQNDADYAGMVDKYKTILKLID